jgi:hypothetical protein
MNTESRLHTVGEVIDAHSRRLISSNEAWKLISFLLLDEIAPSEEASELAEHAELIADLRDGEWHRPDREARAARGMSDKIYCSDYSDDADIIPRRD